MGAGTPGCARRARRVTCGVPPQGGHRRAVTTASAGWRPGRPPRRAGRRPAPGSDQPSGSGLPGRCAQPTTMSRARHSVLHTAMTTATAVSSRVAVRGAAGSRRAGRPARRTAAAPVAGRRRPQRSVLRTAGVRARDVEQGPQYLLVTGRQGGDERPGPLAVLLCLAGGKRARAKRATSRPSAFIRKDRPCCCGRRRPWRAAGSGW